MVKFKKARSMRYDEYEKMGKAEKRGVNRTVTAQFRPKNKSNSKKRRKS